MSQFKTEACGVEAQSLHHHISKKTDPLTLKLDGLKVQYSLFVIYGVFYYVLCIYSLFFFF